MRAFGAHGGEAAPLEFFRARAVSKTGWVAVRAVCPELLKLGAILESTVSGLEGDEEAALQAWRVSCVLRGTTSAEDVLAIASLLLGEESFTRSSSDRDCFFSMFEVHDSKRSSGTATLLASPTGSTGSSADRQRLPVPLTKTSSTSSRTSVATTNPFVSASDVDEDEHTSNDEGTEEGAGVERPPSLRRRISRIATATLRRSIVRTSRQSDPEAPPRTRKVRFLRRHSEDCVYCVDEDHTIEPFDDELENVRRARLFCLGFRVEALPRAAGVSATLVLHVDPQIERSEAASVNPELISAACGRARAEELMARLAEATSRVAAEEQARTWLRLRADWTGKSVQGEPWEMTADREPLQVGCIVRHTQLGMGAIECFDMRGTLKVRYDSAQESTIHGPEDKDKLRVVLGVGNRVRHRSKGPGTVRSTHHADEIRVLYDDGRLRSYTKDTWQRRLRRVNDEDEPLLRISRAGHAHLVEGLARVQFIVHDASPEAVLKSILRRSEGPCRDEAGDVQARRVLRTVSNAERIVWEQRNMPRPLTPRSFVYRETHGKCMSALLVLCESTREPDVPDTQGVVRGFRVVDGWVIEPLYTIGACFITRVLCLDLAGFIAPEAVCSVRETILTVEALGLIHEFRKHRND